MGSRKAVTPSDAEIAACQTATRDLVGVALRSLELLDGKVSLPQFRMLTVLHEIGWCPSSRVATELGLGASSITRLADRLEAAGHVVRGHNPANRSMVTLGLTASGKRLVERVLDWRRAELARILGRLDPDDRAALAAGMLRLHEAVGEQYAGDLHGPVPL
ncbi:MarR family winged helix-turn-helix transcriptional regulator [Rugosimonospora africana]|uniref:Transcriptional regulator n=1 Tax=Rugosimonospora africana TaxID=556532 RepID=A0A8J3QPM8_9ACTN|nr:MarR family transcriptional regulator [Rugosimonospora africana]GIH14134.1 transcriptional regulator [Rugosimonospora africana]